jgi:membrane protein
MLFRLVPYLSIWIALSCLYLFIPNTKVRLQQALIGALVAGTAWQIAQWAYIHFQLGVSRTNAIYGTMSLLPVFMIWIYTGWIIVLAGMELVCQLQSGPLNSIAENKGFDGDTSVKTADLPARGED